MKNKKILMIMPILTVIFLLVIPCLISATELQLELFSNSGLSNRSALNFDGTNDYVNCGNGSSLNLLGDFTISMFIKKSNSNIVYLLQKDGFRVAGIIFAVSASGYVDFYTSQAGAYQRTYSNVVITVNNWFFVVVTRQGTVAKLYVNNVDVTYSGGSHLNPSSSVQPTRLGIEFNGGAPMAGILDEICIYNRVLNQTELTYNYNNGYGKHIPYSISGLVLWLHLNEGIGNIAYDESGYNNNGNINGANWIIGKVKSYLPQIKIESDSTSTGLLYNQTNYLLYNQTALSNGTIVFSGIPENYLGSIFPSFLSVKNPDNTNIASLYNNTTLGGDLYILSEVGITYANQLALNMTILFFIVDIFVIGLTVIALLSSKPFICLFSLAIALVILVGNITMLNNDMFSLAFSVVAIFISVIGLIIGMSEGI